MNLDGHPSGGRPRKKWIDCVKDDMKIKGVSMAMTSDRRHGIRKHVVPTPHSDKGTMMMIKMKFVFFLYKKFYSVKWPINIFLLYSIQVPVK
jgi:hypothetical protein